MGKQRRQEEAAAAAMVPPPSESPLRRYGLPLELAAAEQALRLRDWEPEPYAIRGRARQGKGDVDGALADYDTALRIANPAWPLRKTVETMRDRARGLKPR